MPVSKVRKPKAKEVLPQSQSEPVAKEIIPGSQLETIPEEVNPGSQDIPMMEKEIPKNQFESMVEDEVSSTSDTESTQEENAMKSKCPECGGAMFHTPHMICEKCLFLPFYTKSDFNQANCPCCNAEKYECQCAPCPICKRCCKICVFLFMH